MKILMIIDNLKLGGIQRRFMELLKELRTFEDVSCTVVILNDDIHFDNIFSLGYETIVLKRRIKKDISVVFKLIKISRRFNPDIYHAWGSMSAIYATALKILFHKKMVNSMISNALVPLPFELWFRLKLSKSFSDIILSNSKAGLKAYNVTSPKGRFIHNGVDLKRFNIGSAINEVNLPGRAQPKKIIAMAASFETRKDFSTFVKAAIIILKQYEVEFWAIGGGPLLERIKSESGTFLNNGIYFTGIVKDVETLMAASDIGVLATYTEGISNSLMEFMALSKPVIATDGGGTDELIIDGQCGFLIPEKDPALLAEKIEVLLNSPDLCARMGAEGRKRIESEFCISKMTKSFYELYSSLILN